MADTISYAPMRVPGSRAIALFHREFPLRKRLRRIPHPILGLEVNVMNAGLEWFQRDITRASRCDVECRRNLNAVDKQPDRGGLDAAGVLHAAADFRTAA